MVSVLDLRSGGRWFKPSTGIPSGGSSNIPSRFMLQKLELSAGLMGLLARMQTFVLHLKPWV